MFEFNEKKFELKYNLSRIKMIEQTTGKPIVSEIAENKGLLSASSLETYFALGLKEQGADVFYPTKKGIELVDEMLETRGYSEVAGYVFEALERDCPFLFQ